MKLARQLQEKQSTLMLAKIAIPTICFAAWAQAASPGLNLVKEAKEICEIEVLDFHAQTRPGEIGGREVRDFDLDLLVKDPIKGTLSQGQKIRVKGVQARALHQLARRYEGDKNFPLWCNGLAFRDFKKGEKFLVIGSSNVGENAVSRPDYIQEHDELVESDVKSVLGIDGKSLTNDVDACSSLRVYALAKSAAGKADAQDGDKIISAVKSLIKKCRKDDLVDLANKFSEDLLVTKAEGKAAPKETELKRQLFLASLAEASERLDDEQLATPKLKALIKRHSSGDAKIKREEIRGFSPKLSEMANRRLENWISD